MPTIALHLVSLAVGGLAGWVFALLHVPLPWLLGPMLTSAAISLSGRKLAMPPGTRQLGQLLLGAGIGLNFTPAVALFVIDHILIMVLCAVASIGFGVAAAFYLKAVAKVDMATAYFASVPGGVVEMAIQAGRWGGEPAPVSLAQAMRILCVVTTIPPALILLDWHGASPFAVQSLPFEPKGLAILVLLAGAAGGLMAWRKLTNSWLLGPMAAAAAVTVLQIDLSGMPRELLNLSQVLLGVHIGMRYRRDLVLSLKRFLPHAVLSTVILVGLNVVFGSVVGMLTGLPIPTMVLSVSPGGMAEMCITAAVLDLGVPLIAAFHIVRIFVVIGLSGLLFRYGLGSPPPLDPPRK